MVRVVFKGAGFSITKIIAANQIKEEQDKLISCGHIVTVESITKL